MIKHTVALSTTKDLSQLNVVGNIKDNVWTYLNYILMCKCHLFI